MRPTDTAPAVPEIAGRRFALPLVAAVVATALVVLATGWLSTLLWASVGLIMGAVFFCTGRGARDGYLRYIGAYNAILAAGCLSTGASAVTVHDLRWPVIAAMVVSCVILGALLRWRYRSA
jgi:hypothetical protein